MGPFWRVVPVLVALFLAAFVVHEGMKMLSNQPKDAQYEAPNAGKDQTIQQRLLEGLVEKLHEVL